MTGYAKRFFEAKGQRDKALRRSPWVYNRVLYAWLYLAYVRGYGVRYVGPTRAPTGQLRKTRLEPRITGKRATSAIVDEYWPQGGHMAAVDLPDRYECWWPQSVGRATRQTIDVSTIDRPVRREAIAYFDPERASPITRHAGEALHRLMEEEMKCAQAVALFTAGFDTPGVVESDPLV